MAKGFFLLSLLQYALVNLIENQSSELQTLIKKELESVVGDLEKAQAVFSNRRRRQR